MPYITPEALRTQKVDIYLQDLKDRLKQLREKHNEVIENSVEILKEIDEVSASLLSLNRSLTTKNSTDEKISKIQKLINEFESSKETNSEHTPIVMENRTNINNIINNFEHLNESRMLTESLILFRKAKESFEEIDKFFGKLECLGKTNVSKHSIHLNNCVRNKVNMFNQTQLPKATNPQSKNIQDSTETNKKDNTAKGQMKNVTSETYEDMNLDYVSCTNSLISLNKYHSVDNLFQEQNGAESIILENGYDGDYDDSEYNLLDIKKKLK